MFVAADAAAELVEVAEAEAVGAINDYGVGVRDVDATLDDRRGEQHVSIAVDELGHHFLQIIGVHLAVADEHARLGHERAEPPSNSIDVKHAIVEIEDLAAAVELALDGIADDAF